MKSNILAFIFSILSAVLVVFCVLMYGKSDRKAPEFRFSALNLVYSSDTVEGDLLKGIQAFDSVDGDVSDRIVVEKVVTNTEQGTAVVYYAVSDRSGNVTKQSRLFPAAPAK